MMTAARGEVVVHYGSQTPEAPTHVAVIAKGTLEGGAPRCARVQRNILIEHRMEALDALVGSRRLHEAQQAVGLGGEGARCLLESVVYQVAEHEQRRLGRRQLAREESHVVQSQHTALHSRALFMAWEQRLASAVSGSLLPLPRAATPHNYFINVTRIAADLREAVDELIEPALARLRHDERATDEDCFSSSAGQHLRFRCCVYYSSIAAALLEWRFGDDDVLGASHALAVRPPSPHRALARWLLHPPPHAEPHAIARAEALVDAVGAAGAAGADTRIQDVRQAASQLEGPLGKYATRLSVGGVRGTLWRCEMSTAHTYLVFAPDGGAADGADRDVFVDVSYKQFLVLPEMMAPADFDTAQALDLFADEPDAFVGRAADLSAKMTLAQLQKAFRRIELGAGRSGRGLGAARGGRLSSRPDLAEMVRMRNDGIFALHDWRRRRRICGRPWQVLEQVEPGTAPPPARDLL